jgi:hypothetical protein
MTIKLLRSDGLWKVVGDELLSESSDLEWAALDALLLAELHGTTVELGEGVPQMRWSAGMLEGEEFSLSLSKSRT